MRPVIVGTAGHIDHGKTALVRRLTGIDTDRLKEEKERGISIDLGFAHLVLPSGARVGIVDVPGHERFVKNMLAGATGIDVALLVVAADEGVKPQTREHLAIVDLLGIRRGVVALTKSDLVPAERIAAAHAETEALLRGTRLEGSPILPVSAVTGDGVKALLEALDRAAADAGARDAARPARLPIDRVFSIEGIGTVVTGTLWSGSIRPGDALQILPSNRTVRVRRVEVHDAEVAAAAAGQRTAVALHGAGREEIERGEWLVAPGRYRAATTLDVRLTMLPGGERGRALATRTRLRIHLGASEALGRAVLLEGEALEPGASAYAQLRLETPVVAAPGDRLVLRSYSPAVTVAGAVVVDPAPPRRSRLGERDRERLRVLESGTPREKAAWVASEGGLSGARDEETALRIGAAPEEVAAAVAGEPALVRLRDGRALARPAWERALARITEEVRRYAEAHRLRAGAPKGELKSALAREIEGAVFDEALAALAGSGAVSVQGDRVFPPGSAPTLSDAERQAVEAIERRLEGQGFQPPELKEVLAGLGTGAGSAGGSGAAAAGKGGKESRAQELVRYMLESGRAVKVTSELIYTRRQWEEIERRVAAHFAASPRMGMADFKNGLQISRKYAVPLLEHMDRLGITRREGDERVPGPRLKK